MYYFCLFSLLIFSFFGLVISILTQIDSRAGWRFNDFANGRGRNGPKKGYVKPFKDTDVNPLLYIKIIPVIIHFIIFLVAIIMYFLLWIFPDVFEPILSSNWCLAISIGIYLVPCIYGGSLAV